MDDNQRQAVQYAYIAGLIDGEGTITITKQNNESFMKRQKLKNPRYLALLRIGMIEEKPIRFIEKVLKVGKVYKEPPRKDRPTCRLMYRWICTNTQECLRILRDLYPYMLVKNKQAKIVMEFAENYVCGTKRNGTSPEEVRRRERLHQKVRKLNAVGAAATTNPSDTSNSEVIV